MMNEFYTVKYRQQLWLAYESNKLPYDLIWGFTRLIKPVNYCGV